VSVKLDGENGCLDREFVLVISAHPSVEEVLPHATLEIHPDLEGPSAMVVETPPSFMLRDQTPMKDTEVIFLADRSAISCRLSRTGFSGRYCSYRRRSLAAAEND
jgi:hypothetical protein